MAMNIHLIVGEDDFLTERIVKNVLDRLIPEESRADASIERINGNCGNIDSQAESIAQLKDSIMTPPFLEPFKVTWWQGVTFLPQQSKPSEEIKDAMLALANDLANNPLPDNQALIITGTKMLASSKFAKTMKTLGEVQVLPAFDKRNKQIEAASGRVGDFAAEFGLKFAPGVDNTFIAKVGTDSRTIFSELDKLQTWLGPGNTTITTEAVAAVSSPGGGEPEIWDLTDAVGSRNPAKIRSVLSFYEDDTSSTILLTNVVEKYFRNLIVYRDALDRKLVTAYGVNQGADPAALEALQATSVNLNGWVLRKNCEQASSFTMNELRLARWKILQIREKTVSSGSAGGLALIENALMEIVRRRAPAKR